MILPSGTLTFLFTDIEGSTRLWEQHALHMQAALERHDAILRTAIEERGGYVFKTIGDAFCAAFPTALDAVRAAVDAQGGLHAAEWETTIPVQSRMALHTGVAQVRDEDYFGPPLNRAARLLSVGHGGQILLSHAAQSLVEDLLPPEFSLLDMGEHRLKDLARPEHIFQLLHPSLRSDFPSLKTLNQCPNNLPAQSTRLVGREKTLESLLAIFRKQEARLLTLTGPGGAGKTRLGLQAAAEMLDLCGQGVFFVPLAPISDPALVIPAIAHVLGIEERADRTLQEGIETYIQDGQMLLMLDNFEQVVAAAPRVSELLQACPNLKALVTSRIVLHLRGEQEFAVPPLTLPNRRPPPSPETLSQYGAVQLFVECARAVKPDFAITNESAPAVAEICARLDGLPLAIELAAARTKLFAPIALLARLENRLKMLTGGARDVPVRHQTLRGAIAWSYDLLSEPEKRLFCQLSVFVGGCTLEAVEAILSDDGAVDVLEVLSTLADNSLLQQAEGEDGEPRFYMLETICEYATERLRESEEQAKTQQRHANYYTDVAETAYKGIDVADAVQRLRREKQLRREHANLHSALGWAMEHSPGQALRLAVAWFTRPPSERGKTAERALAAALREADSSRMVISDELISEALGVAARDAGWRGDFAWQKALAVQRLEHVRHLNNPMHIAWTLHALGFHALILGSYKEARGYFHESIALFRSLHADLPAAWTLIHLAGGHAYQLEYAPAYACLAEAQLIFKREGDQDGVASALAETANLLSRQGNLTQARLLFDQVARIEAELEDERTHPWRRFGLAWLEMREGNYAAAESHLRYSLRTFEETTGTAGENKRMGVLFSLVALGCLAGRIGQWQRAAGLLGAEEAQREAAHLPMSIDAAQDYQPIIDAGREAIGAEQWERHWQEGRAMTRQQSLLYALDENFLESQDLAEA